MTALATRDRERVKVLLAVNRTPMSTVDIAGRAGLRCEDTRSALESLRRKGLVRWHAHGTVQAKQHITPLGEYVQTLLRSRPS